MGRVSRRIKVKADPYFGTDSRKIGDRGARRSTAPTTGCLAFEAIANTLDARARLDARLRGRGALLLLPRARQTQDEVRALLAEPDEVFFSELAVERDELLVLPMDKTRAWFEAHYQDYPPRPVMHDGGRVVVPARPRADVEKASAGISSVGRDLLRADSVGVIAPRPMRQVECVGDASTSWIRPAPLSALTLTSGIAYYPIALSEALQLEKRTEGLFFCLAGVCPSG